MLAALLVLLGGVTGEPALVRGVSMAGPFPTMAAAMRDVRCGTVELDPGERVRAKRVDGAVVGHMKAPAPFLALHLRAVNCRVAGLRDGDEDVMAFAQRPDGWWRSAVLHAYGGSDKYCDGEMKASFSTRQVIAGGADEIVITADARTGCVACSKQGSDDDFVTFLVVLADVAGGAPQSFPAIATARRWTQDPMDDGSSTPGGKRGDPDYCARVRRKVVLSVKWEEDTLVLDGDARWPSTDQDGKQRAPSTAGRHRFVLGTGKQP